MSPSPMTMTIRTAPQSGETLWCSLISFNPHSTLVQHDYPYFKVTNIKPRACTSLAHTQITNEQHNLKLHVGFMTISINIRKRASLGCRGGACITAIYLGGLFALFFKFSGSKAETWLATCETDDKLKVKEWVQEQIWTPHCRGTGQLSLTEQWYHQLRIKQSRFLRRCKIATKKIQISLLQLGINSIIEIHPAWYQRQPGNHVKSFLDETWHFLL